MATTGIRACIARRLKFGSPGNAMSACCFPLLQPPLSQENNHWLNRPLAGSSGGGSSDQRVLPPKALGSSAPSIKLAIWTADIQSAERKTSLPSQLTSLTLVNPPTLPNAWSASAFQSKKGFSSEKAVSREPRPVEVKLLQKEKALEIEFDDGRRFRFAAELLRVKSPAADSARSPRRGGRERVVVAGRRHVGILGVEPIGNYAISLAFDDLHRTGIYTWQFLHDLGEHKWRHMRKYVEALRAQGRSRDPPRRGKQK